MKLTVLIFVAVLTCSSLFGQAAALVSQLRTFHIQGTVTDATGAVVTNVKVTFKSGQGSQIFVTNNVGRYEADLPLGDYTMQERTAGFGTYHRPPFRVSEPVNLTFDIRLQIGRCGDMVITNSSGRPPTDDEMYAATADCRHEDLFPLSPHGNQFQLSIQHETRSKAAGIFSYAGASHEDPVALAYNLFSLHADRLVYNAKHKTLEARGNVVVEDESGKRSADAMSFRLEDSHATQQR